MSVEIILRTCRDQFSLRLELLLVTGNVQRTAFTKYQSIFTQKLAEYLSQDINLLRRYL